MRRTRAVSIAALAATAALMVASCSTAEPDRWSAGRRVTSAAATSGSARRRVAAAGYTRPAVASSGNVTVAVEEPPHDYNNNTGSANNFSNSLVTGLDAAVADLHHQRSDADDRQRPDGLDRADQHQPADDRLQAQPEGCVVGRHPGQLQGLLSAVVGRQLEGHRLPAPTAPRPRPSIRRAPPATTR